MSEKDRKDRIQLDKIIQCHLAMDIAEVLKLADQLLFTHTGEHLDLLQETILKGTLQGNKYAEIASENHLSEGHVRDTASELWQTLSKTLGEDINKLNARSILEKVIISNSVSSGNFISIHQVSICPKQQKKPKCCPLLKPSEKNHLDLDATPEITAFFGRNHELNTLKTWLIQDHIRMITLVGILGIGKTMLAVKLIEEIQTKFQYIIYRSLQYCPTIDVFLTDLLQSVISPAVFPNSLDRQVDLLLKFIKKHRCLIIIDDLQMLFETGQYAGQYKLEFEGYYLLFKQIAELSHPSSFLLITSEQPEYLTVDSPKFFRSLKLSGLGDCATKILKNKELLDQENWHDLIEKYQGHPLWLEMTATMIQELFSSRVTDFLAYPELILSNEITFQLNRLWSRLTKSEQQVINYLAKQENEVALMQVLQEIPDQPTDILKTIQSLKRRCLLEDTSYTDQHHASLLKINSILKYYIISQY
ncbi:AAA family ATPase [Planktothrix mougeotii]|nr:ATP-binding protein [Planktothrix mougeotii]